MSNEIAAALIGGTSALVGAVVGALATGDVTRRLGRKAREEEEFGHDDVAAFSVQQKLLRIYSAALEDVFHFRDARARQAQTPESHISMMVKAFANFPSRQEFTVAELYSLNRMGRHALVGLVAGLDHQHNAMNESLRVFVDQRSQLIDGWNGKADDEGRVSTLIPTAEYEVIRHRFLRLDDLVVQMEEMAKDLVRNSMAALEGVTKAQGSHLGQKISVTLNQADGPPITFESLDEEARRRLGKGTRRRAGKRRT